MRILKKHIEEISELTRKNVKGTLTDKEFNRLTALCIHYKNPHFIDLILEQTRE